MGKLFITKRLANPLVIAADSTLIKAKKGLVWHKSIKHSTYILVQVLIKMQGGDSANKGWLFGYKLHLAASIGSLIVPLAADYTQ